MRLTPKLNYCGITIVMSNPSRFDTKQLLSGYAGDWFCDLLRPSFNRFQCDIISLDEFQDVLPGTKVIICLGEVATKQLKQSTQSHTIHQLRGSHFFWHNIPVVPSYLPQDTFDPVDHESTHNPWLQGKHHEQEEAKADGDSDEKNKGRTSRTNWRFWLSKDVNKAIRICKDPTCLGQTFKPNYNIYAPIDNIVSTLESTKNKTFYLDIETDSDFNVTMFGFNFDSSDIVYVVPIYRYNYTLAYSAVHKILRALAIAMRDNLIVCHNAMFDLFILSWKYKLPFSRNIFDTMLAHHRCFPEVEKSLGHCVSLWTYEPYHKDENVFMPNNSEQEYRAFAYNGKDVYTTRLVRESILAYARTQPGLLESIDQANSCIRPYLINTLFGIHFNDEKRQKIIHENDRRMTQLLRIIEFFVGDKLLPTSPQQVVNYMHVRMGYKVIGRTDTNAASLKGELMEKLKLQHPENPVITLCLAYRGISKETGSLKFNPWKVNECNKTNVS